MKKKLRAASFRPRVQTRKGSLAALGIVGNGFVLAILPFCLIAFIVLAPLYLVAAALFGRGTWGSGQEAG